MIIFSLFYLQFLFTYKNDCIFGMENYKQMYGEMETFILDLEGLKKKKEKQKKESL